ncbi:hypothetical protein WCX49_06640 [Sulfurimonas sp. HSL-1656]|uniref:hypothetical protein n=1 Tax=Thiomicrolovo subterrani TaxID=3131934 RepID=UPI0031F89467
MGYHVSIPKRIIYDKRLRDVDLRLYTIIAEACNAQGFSEITNGKLMELSGKAERPLQKSLKSLQDGNYIVVVHNVKASDVYPKNLPRVIWLEEAHASHKGKAARERRKTRENDYRLFVQWLKADCKNIYIPVEIGGLVHKYMIHSDGLLYRYETGERPSLMSSEDSAEVYKKMFRKKSVVIRFMEDGGHSTAIANLAQLAQQKRIDHDNQ